MDQRLSIRDQLDQGIRVLDFEMAAITGDWICATEDERDGRDGRDARDANAGTIAVAPVGAAPSAIASNCTCEHHLTLKGHCFSCCPFIVSHGNLKQSVTLDFGCKHILTYTPTPTTHNTQPRCTTIHAHCTQQKIHISPSPPLCTHSPLVVRHVYPHFNPLPGVRCLLIQALHTRVRSLASPILHHPPSPTSTNYAPPTPPTANRYLPRCPVRHRHRLGASKPFRDRHPVLNRHPRQPISVLRGHRRPPPRYRSTRPRVEPRPVGAVGGITVYDQPVSYAGRDAKGQ